jgi:hypothetical protein
LGSADAQKLISDGYFQKSVVDPHKPSSFPAFQLLFLLIPYTLHLTPYILHLTPYTVRREPIAFILSATSYEQSTLAYQRHGVIPLSFDL